MMPSTSDEGTDAGGDLWTEMWQLVSPYSELLPLGPASGWLRTLRYCGKSLRYCGKSLLRRHRSIIRKLRKVYLGY